MIGIVDKTGEPSVGRFALLHLGGAGLGAYGQITELLLAVGAQHIAAHHAAQCGIGVGRPDGLADSHFFRVDQGKTGHGGLPGDQMGLCCLAVCGNGAHQRHHGTRIHQIVILADTRPAQLIVVADLKGTGFRADAADLV